MTHTPYLRLLLTLLSLQGASLAQNQFLFGNSILNSLQSITESTIPSNGDVNPYGVAFVPSGFPGGGKTAAGDVLVSNFNNNGTGNVEGTGSSIVSISPTGQQSLFATSTPIGLDTALGVLSRGFVIVGNLPASGGVPVNGASIQIFDRNGNLVSTLTDSTFLDSPWDLTINDQGSEAQVFVSNVLSGTVTRLDLNVGSTAVTVAHKTRIASGYKAQLITAVVAVGPTGLAYDPNREVLYVASTDDNAIFAIGDAGGRTSDAGKGSIVFDDQTHLHGPLGLVLAPNGNLITANGDAVNVGGTPNDLVEFTPQGILVATYQLDGGTLGAAFGIASTFSQGAVRFAAVDDDLNTVTVWTLHSLF